MRPPIGALGISPWSGVCGEKGSTLGSRTFGQTRGSPFPSPCYPYSQSSANPDMTDPTPSRVYFENSHPILRVGDMKTALAFYVDKLGFQNASWGTEDFTSVSRDRAGIYLCRGGQGRGGAWVWVGVEDATRLHEELLARGVAIRMPLTNFTWALEFHVEDPDGNVLRFGSEPLAGNRREDLPRWEHGG